MQTAALPSEPSCSLLFGLNSEVTSSTCWADYKNQAKLSIALRLRKLERAAGKRPS
jgi:hypothetical protein